jgi:hypothetical protein
MAIRMQIIFIHFSLLILALASCGVPTSEATPQVVSIYSTPAAEPWLTDVYTCARTFAVLSRVADPSIADVVLRVGEPEFLSAFVYQVDLEEILIVTHRQSPIQNFTLEDARALFMGLGDPSVQVWVYSSDTDVQKVFDQLVMKGRSVTSFARLAVSPQNMSDTLN